MSHADLTEEFRPVKDYPAYRVSNLGRAQSCWKHAGTGQWVMSDEWHDIGSVGPLGYVVLTLRAYDQKPRETKLHTLILETFVGPCPPGMQACHDPDPTKTNCRLDNLRWDTGKNNIADMKKHGTCLLGSRHPRSILREEDIGEILRLYSEGHLQKDIASRLGVGQSAISGVLTGRLWSHLTGIVRTKKRVRRSRK